MGKQHIAVVLAGVMAASVLLTGCQTTYYAMWEKMGKEKRHLLRDQVQDSRTDQEKASEAFKDALTRLKEIYGLEGGDLEAMYNRLSDNYDNCQEKAETIDDRIDRIQRIASDLFAEWRQELSQIQNPKFRSQSASKLKATQTRFASLESSLLMARKRMNPVLSNLKDYVLYLKHNLNAQAIGSLKGEADSIEMDVNRLVRDIQKSIKEADAFLIEFEKG